MKSVVFLSALILIGGTLAEDYLVSKRLRGARFSKRGALSSYNITFLHLNDVHAHLDQYRLSGTDCDPPASTCVGGYARIKTKLNEIRASSGNSLTLNMGDEFQGTLFFSFYGGSKIAETVNNIGFDAMTIGNHEFDNGNDHLAQYLKNMTAPVISANIRTNNSALASRIKPYHVFPEHSLAVIGLTTIHTKTTSSPDAGTEFLDPVEVLQRTVEEINANEKVDRIIAMTHIGYAEDIDLAQRTRGIHLILGGHSHTLLGDLPEAEGPYPTIRHNLDGEEVFIVTAWRWGQVLGYINIVFEGDSSGRVIEYSGGPIPMESNIEQDESLQNKIDAWREPFDGYAKEVVGVVADVLDATQCQKWECTFGNFVSDAILDYRRYYGAKVDGAIMNAGGIRASIPAGNVTRGQIITSFPFGNAVVDLTFTGAELWDMFEGIVSWQNSAGKEVTSFVQVSRTITLTYAPSLPPGSRLRTLSIDGTPLSAPSEGNLDNQRTFIISTIDFIATGGDGFLDPPKKAGPPLETLDVVLADYVTLKSPFTPFLDGRIAQEGTVSSGQRQIVVNTCFGLRCGGN